MICADRDCNCGITSASLTITGSGSLGDPWTVETNAFAIVTSLTRPTGFIGQHIFETDTMRDLVFDGTNWVIMGGNRPGCQLERQTALTVTNDTNTAIPLLVEVHDDDGYHTSTNDFFTVPTKKGGDYLVTWHGRWAANATGYRYVRPVISSNGAPAPTQNNSYFSGGFAMINTANDGNAGAMQVRLKQGAQVSLQCRHTAGADLDLTSAVMACTLLRHIPSLV